MVEKANIKQKLMTSIICIMLIINFAVPNYSQANNVMNNLFGPIKGLVCLVADTCMTLVQWCFIGDFDMITPETVEHGNKERWGGFLWLENGINWPSIKITPEEIFQGKIPALNVNFITEPSTNLQEEYDKRIAEIDERLKNPDLTSEAREQLEAKKSMEQQDLALTTDGTQTALVKLRNTISSWYMTLRNIAIVGLLCVLVYVGIRMMLCSIASEKAKYKQMFMDWVIALCLIFFLHYIMALTMTITEQITGIFSSSSVVGIKIMQEDAENDKLIDQGKTIVNNLMEYVRLYVNLNDMGQSCAFIIIYVWLVVYTVKFIITYVKRFIHMAFLTMIAPLVALTYPIDKISDGKAQAFNMWLKDYIFNALIQPFHLIIYTVFVSSAIEFATSNLIYACVAIGFIPQAEKFLRKMFGFDRAPNPPGGLGSFASGAVAGNLLSKATSAIGKGASGGNGGKGVGSDKGAKPPKTTPGAESFAGSGQGSNSGGDSKEIDAPKDQNNDSNEIDGNDPRALNSGYEGENSEETNFNTNEIQQQLEGENEGREESAEESGVEANDLEEGKLPHESKYLPEKLEAEKRAKEQAKQQANNNKSGDGKKADNGKKKINGWKDKAKTAARYTRAVGGALAPYAGKLAKTGLKAAGVGVGAVAGGIHALATDGDILKGMATGAGVGAGIGKAAGNLPGAIGNTARGIKSTAQNLGADFKAITNKEEADRMRYKNNFMNNKAKRDYAKKYFANSSGGTLYGKELDQKMEQLYDLEMAGITDVDTQKKLMSYEDQQYEQRLQQAGIEDGDEGSEELRKSARNQAIYAYDTAKAYKETDIMDKSEKIKGDLTAKMMEANPSLTQKEAEWASEEAFKGVAYMKGVNYANIKANEAKASAKKQQEAKVAEQARREKEEDREWQRRGVIAQEKIAGIKHEEDKPKIILSGTDEFRK